MASQEATENLGWAWVLCTGVSASEGQGEASPGGVGGEACAAVELCSGDPVLQESALAVQSRAPCPQRLQLGAQRCRVGAASTALPVLPSENLPASGLWLQVKTAGLQARRLRPGRMSSPRHSAAPPLWGGLPDSLG